MQDGWLTRLLPIFPQEGGGLVQSDDWHLSDVLPFCQDMAKSLLKHNDPPDLNLTHQHLYISSIARAISSKRFTHKQLEGVVSFIHGIFSWIQSSCPFGSLEMPLKTLRNFLQLLITWSEYEECCHVYRRPGFLTNNQTCENILLELVRKEHEPWVARMSLEVLVANACAQVVVFRRNATTINAKVRIDIVCVLGRHIEYFVEQHTFVVTFIVGFTRNHRQTT